MQTFGIIILVVAVAGSVLAAKKRPISPPPTDLTQQSLTASKWFSRAHAGARVPKKSRLPNYKLHYFDIRFRGEPIRLIFAYKNVPLDDYRVKDADWPILKGRYPYGQLPVLDIDKVRIPQSFAIYHYLGRKFGLSGANDIDNAKIESLSEEFRELEQKCTLYLDMLLGTAPGGPTPPAEKEKQLQSVVAPAIKLHGGRLEKALAESKSGYFGSVLSWVDFVVADFTKTLLDNASKRYMVYNKQLRVHMNKVYALPGVKEYVAKRKEAPV